MASRSVAGVRSHSTLVTGRSGEISLDSSVSMESSWPVGRSRDISLDSSVSMTHSSEISSLNKSSRSSEISLYSRSHSSHSNMYTYVYPPAPMNHVQYLRAGPAEMPFRNWYTANTNHFHLTDSVRWK